MKMRVRMERTAAAVVAASCLMSGVATADDTYRLKMNFADDDGTAVLDLSGHQRDGVVSGSPTFLPSSGLRDGVYQLDGIDDHITVPAGTMTFAQNGVNKPFSISLWMKRPSASTLDSQVLVAKLTAVEPILREWQMYYMESDGQVRMQLIDKNVSSVGKKSNPNVVGALLKDGNWHQIVATYNGAMGYNAFPGLKLYVDGVECGVEGCDSNLSDILNTSAPVTIGYKPASVNQHFKGMLDEVKIYEYALSSAEIQTLYAARTWPNVMVKYSFNYPMSPAQNGTLLVIDQSGHQLDSSAGTFAPNPTGPLFDLAGINGSPCISFPTGAALGDYIGLNPCSTYNQYLSFADQTPNHDKPFTISMWVYPTLDRKSLLYCKQGWLNSPGNIYCMNGTSFMPMNEYGLGYEQGNKISFGVGGLYVDGGWDHYDRGIGVDSNPSTCPVSLNTWSHIVATYTGDPTQTTSLKVYVNGVECTVFNSQRTDFTGMTTTDSLTWVGAEQPIFGGTAQTSQSFKGKMDDVIVLDQALTATQVQTLYQQGQLLY